MATARAVIGSNFGDEGKGLIVDMLACQGGNVVVRFNGGAQAGHTVVTPEGKRHVFSHFGAGSFCGLPTYLSEFFICNPILFLKELAELQTKLDTIPKMYAHPKCLVTTFADMMINQQLEDKRGKDRHGSVGVGVSETVERSTLPELSITMGDLWNTPSRVEKVLDEICNKYACFRVGRAIDEPEMIEAFLKSCAMFADMVEPLGIDQCNDPIFEGAQGLLLDQNNKDNFPHVTRSNTGIKNVRELCSKAGIDDIEAYYVSRTYLTKHGAGPLIGEDKDMSYSDATNITNEYQGSLRFAPLDQSRLVERCTKDFGSTKFKLVLTHCDQKKNEMSADLYSHGPCRNDISLKNDS